MDIEPPGELYGYKFVKAEGLGKIVGDDGLNIICYYEDPSVKLPVEYKVEYDWGTDYPDSVVLPKNDKTYQSEAKALADKDTTYTDQSTITAQKDGKKGEWTFSGWTAKVEDAVVKFTGKWTFTVFVDAAIPADIKLVSAEYETGIKLQHWTARLLSVIMVYYLISGYKSDKADNFNGTAIDGQNGETFVAWIRAKREPITIM